MTLPSRTFFRLSAPVRWRLVWGLFGLLAHIPLPAATFSGAVQLRDSRVDSVTRHKDYSGIVISLEPVSPTPVPPPAKHVVMLQKNKMFTPHVLPILVGAAVDFPNADPIFHNAFSRYEGQIFDVGLYPPGTSRSVRFTRPGIVRVFCNIHPSMSAVILVFQTPWYVSTAKDGSFQLDVPPGAYNLHVFHERASEAALQSLSRRVLVTAQGLRLEPIVISEAGNVIAPHKNKYGADYAPPPDDQNVYPGVRK